MDPGRPVRRGELVAQQLALAAPAFVGGDHLAVGRDLVARQLDPARPGVGAAPGHDAAPVRVGAHRHPAGVPEPDRAAAVGDDHVVDRRHPGVEGAVDVVDSPRAEQREQRLEAEVAEHRGRIADGQAAAAVPVDLEQQPALGRQHLDGHRVGAAHRDGLLVTVDDVVEGLLEDVLVVGHRVGDRPRHLARVREVLHARDAGEGEAEHVELVRREPHLRVDTRRLEGPVRVTADQRPAGCGARTADRPGVAAGAVRRVAGQQRLVGAEHGPRAVVPELGRHAREEEVLGVEDGQRRPRLPGRRLDVEPDQLGGRVRRRCVQPGVHTIDVRRDEGAGLLPQPVERPPGRVDDPGLPRPGVPRQLGGAEHLGGGAGRAAALVLQLPGAVARGRPALPVGEVEHVGGPDVRDAVRVAVDPSHAGEATRGCGRSGRAGSPRRP